MTPNANHDAWLRLKADVNATPTAQFSNIHGTFQVTVYELKRWTCRRGTACFEKSLPSKPFSHGLSTRCDILQAILAAAAGASQESHLNHTREPPDFSHHHVPFTRPRLRYLGCPSPHHRRHRHPPRHPPRLRHPPLHPHHHPPLPRPQAPSNRNHPGNSPATSPQA